MSRFSAGFATSVGLALCGALPLASAAMAQPVAQPSHLDADVSGFRGTPETLVHVIARVERDTDGKVVEARFSNAGGQPGYFVAVDEGGQVAFLRLEREDGALIQVSETTRPSWMLHWRGRADLKAAEQAKVSLIDAVRTAEKATDGAPAVAAGIARSASNPTSAVQAYNVLVLRGGDTHRVSVDDATNEVIADPRTLADWP